MAQIFYDCEVVDIREETPVVRTFSIKYPETVPFRFKAGQFIILDLPIVSKYTTRSYSIASAPSENNIIELCIVLKQDGPGTNYLFNEVKNGSTIKSSAAIGKFTLPEVIDHNICFICTGTGVAPFRSMIREIFNKNIPHQKLYLLFGNRFEKDILYRKEFEELEQQHPEFKFIPVLSRETSAEWKGEKGYVHDIYRKLFTDKNHPTYFYICGWANMLKETRQNLEGMGYFKTQIRFESFD